MPSKKENKQESEARESKTSYHFGVQSFGELDKAFDSFKRDFEHAIAPG